MKTSMKKKFRQTLAMLFAVAMVFTSIPQTAYAAEANNVETTEIVEATTVAETESVEVVESAEEVVEIEEGVDLAEGEVTSYTVTEAAEGATITYIENCVIDGVIAVGAELVFTVSADEAGKEVDKVSCTVGEEEAAVTAETAENGTIIYTVAADQITGNIKIVVTLKDAEAAEQEIDVASAEQEIDVASAEQESDVASVTVTPDTITVEQGASQQFTATVTLSDDSVDEAGVEWSVAGGTDGTTISETGLLTVAEDETATTIMVIATSKSNTEMAATATVTVAEPAPATYTVDFDVEEGASISDVTVAGEPAELAEDGTLANVEENSVVTFKVNTEETHKVAAVKTVVGETETTITSNDEGVYSVTVAANVTIKVETEKYNKLTIAKDEDSDANSFVVVVPNDNGGQSGLVPGDCAYSESNSFEIQVDPKAGYQVDEVVLINGDTEEAQWNEDGTVKLNPTVAFTEEVTEFTVKVTTSVIKREKAATVVFANASDNMAYEVTTNDNVVKTAGKSNTYDVLEGADYVSFKVTATGAYEPYVELNGVEVTGEKGATSKGKTAYTYKVVANALETDNTITINETIADVLVTVSYVEDDVLLSAANVDGVRTVPTDESTEGDIKTVSYAVPYGSTVTLTAAANDNCKLTGAVTTVGTKAKNESIKNNQVTFSVKATDYTNTVITSEKLYKVFVCDRTAIIEPVNGVYNIGWLNSGERAAGISVFYGGGYARPAVISISDYKLTDSNKKPVESILFRGEGGIFLTLDKSDAGKTLVATVTVDDGTEAGKTFTVKFKVAPFATKVTVKGVKNGVLSQAADTTKEYALTFNPKGVSDIYEAEVTPADAGVTAKIEGGKLVVTTPQTVGEKVALVKIYNTAASTDTEKAYITGDFNVTVTDPIKNVKPTVKLKSSNDVELTLTLGAKNVAEPNKGKVYYKVDVTSVDKDEAVQNEIADPFYIEKTGDTQDATIKVNTSDFGSVHKSVKYNVTVTLVQTKAGETLEYRDDAAADKILFTSQPVIANNLATKAAYYETNLKLKKGTTTVYTGQQDVVVATAQFSKQTTYTSLSEVYSNENGYVTPTVENGNQIKVNVSASANPGKYTITAVATAPENTTPATATITINVVRGIENIIVDVPSTKVYKPNGKAATLTAKVSYNNKISWKQPKTKKVTWSIVKDDGSSLSPEDYLYGKVSVKNGKVTIAKNYVVSNNEEDNQFRVRATAADWKGTTVYGESNLITIKASAVSLGEVILVDEVYDSENNAYVYNVVGRSGSVLTTKQIADMVSDGLGAVVLKKGAVEKDSYTEAELYESFVDVEDATFSVSNKAVSMSADGRIDSVSKAVKNVKITATTTDGSKKKAVLSNLTITYPEVNDLCLEIEDAEVTDPVKPTELTYSASANEEVEVSIYNKTADGEEEWFSGAVNHTLKVKKGGKLTLAYPEEGYYYFMPTAKVTTFELTDKANKVKKTYTLTNTSWSETAAPAVTTSDIFYAGYCSTYQTATFSIADGYDYTGKVVRISFDPVEIRKNSDYSGFVDQYRNYSGEIAEISPEGKIFLTWDWSGGSTIFNKGSYKVYFTFGTVATVDNKTVFTAETKTTSATVKVVDPVKSTFKPTTSYKMYVKDGLAVNLTGTGKGVDLDTLYFYDLQNVNVNGQANKFMDYFELGDDGRSIVLKPDVNVDDITANDLKANLSYYVENSSLAYNACNGTCQIKISLEKTKTSQSYALTNLEVTGNEVSGTVSAYVGSDETNKVSVSYAYSTSDKFNVTADDGDVNLTTKEVLEYGDYTVEAYIVTEANGYAYKVAQLKVAYDACSTEETDKKAEFEKAYVDAIKTHGVKVKTTVTINKASN